MWLAELDLKITAKITVREQAAFPQAFQSPPKGAWHHPKYVEKISAAVDVRLEKQSFF
ncbi:MAG: hypothetical protein GX295_09050 [Syntrophomonadaceae bacterium]|nr:hypothetical protein [Syntrophomonadaceae bacterium]